MLLLLIGQVHAQTPAGSLRPINGTALYLQTVGRGEPLLVIHGGPGLNHQYFNPHLEKLSKDFTVILYDQRASGRSAIPSTDSLGLKYFVDDIDAIRRDLGYEKINILAHSWGAILAVRYGMDFPDRVKTMILCNPVALSHEFDAETAANQKRSMTKADSIERASLIRSPEFKSGNKEAYEKIMLLSFRHSFYKSENLSRLRMNLPENFAQASKALYTGLGKDLGQYDYYPACKEFRFPVTILHGKSDAIPLKATEKLKASIPKARLVVFEKSGHFIFIEEPGKFRDALIETVRD